MSQLIRAALAASLLLLLGTAGAAWQGGEGVPSTEVCLTSSMPDHSNQEAPVESEVMSPRGKARANLSSGKFWRSRAGVKGPLTMADLDSTTTAPSLVPRECAPVDHELHFLSPVAALIRVPVNPAPQAELSLQSQPRRLSAPRSTLSADSGDAASVLA